MGLGRSKGSGNGGGMGGMMGGVGGMMRGFDGMMRGFAGSQQSSAQTPSNQYPYGGMGSQGMMGRIG